MEKGMATHSSILAWRISRTEEPGRLQPRGHKESDMTVFTTTVSYVILVPWPGIELVPSAVEVQSLNHCQGIPHLKNLKLHNIILTHLQYSCSLISNIQLFHYVFFP